jgi:hypothetical protein
MSCRLPCLVLVAALAPALLGAAKPKPAAPPPEDDDPAKGIGGMGAAQEKVSQNQSADALLNGRVGPAIVQTLEGKKLVSWENSVVHTKIARTRIVAGALTKKLSDNELSTLLTDNNKSSDISTNPYVKVTKDGENSYEVQLASKIKSAKGPVAPQDVLGWSLEVCHNDYWLATLTAHNLLKEVTYAQREGLQANIGTISGNGARDILLNPNDIATKLIDLRPEGDPKFKDRMGPWYHAFGLFFVGGITSGTEAQVLADVENLTRLLRAGSPPDDGKERVNLWAARLSSKMNGSVAKNAGDKGERTQRAKAERPPKDSSKLSKPDLERFIDSLKAEHKALQDELVALPPGADATGNAIRVEQKELYQEVMHLKQELGKRK